MNGLVKTLKNVKNIKVYGLVLLSAVLLFPISQLTQDNKIMTVYMNENKVGHVEKEEDAKDALTLAKHQLNQNNKELTLVDVKLTYEEAKRGTKTDDIIVMKENMYQILEDTKKESKELAYNVKIEDYTVTLASKDDVVKVLEEAQSKYNKDGSFGVELVEDETQVVESLTTSVVKASKSTRQNNIVSSSLEDYRNSDSEKLKTLKAKDTSETKDTSKKIAAKDADTNKQVSKETRSKKEETNKTDSKKQISKKQKSKKQKSKKQEHIVNIDFKEEIKVQETYVSPEKIVSVEEAVLDITKEKETNKTYGVKAGDTLSTIAQDHDMSLNRLLKLNNLKDTSAIFPGDDLIITVPKPELSVLVQKEKIYEEKFSEDVVYVENSDKYEGSNKVLRKGKKGVRSVTALVTYNNGDEYNTEIIDKEVITQPVAKKVERGTKVRPTFIKPLSGGTFTSGYGARWGSTHKGIDWACPTGTSVVASSGGTVISAGWSNGYGKSVLIQHVDGKMTRYGHMSELRVTAGQSVEQGDQIGLSGNTGRSTGPHVHFEILINGSQVNPFDYLN